METYAKTIAFLLDRIDFEFHEKKTTKISPYLDRVTPYEKEDEEKKKKTILTFTHTQSLKNRYGELQLTKSDSKPLITKP